MSVDATMSSNNGTSDTLLVDVFAAMVPADSPLSVDKKCSFSAAPLFEFKLVRG